MCVKCADKEFELKINEWCNNWIYARFNWDLTSFFSFVFVSQLRERKRVATGDHCIYWGEINKAIIYWKEIRLFSINVHQIQGTKQRFVSFSQYSFLWIIFFCRWKQHSTFDLFMQFMVRHDMICFFIRSLVRTCSIKVRVQNTCSLWFVRVKCSLLKYWQNSVANIRPNFNCETPHEKRANEFHKIVWLWCCMLVHNPNKIKKFCFIFLFSVHHK